MTTKDFYYSIDTSALIHGWVRAYPIAVPMFRPVWDRIEQLIANGRLRASAEVLTEIEKQDDDLTKWCKARPALFAELDDPIQQKVAYLLGKYPRMVDTSKGRSGADPFVVAYAMTQSPILTVVTEERGGSDRKPKIPSVCLAESLRCINLLDLLTEQS